MPRVVAFRTLLDRLRNQWVQGEHITLLGPTGTGKTVVARRLLALRDYVVVLGTKPRDPALAVLAGSGYVRIRAWPPPEDADRVLLWPEASTRDDLDAQREVMAEALDSIYAEGGWTLYVDELAWIDSRLKLRSHLTDLWMQGRSNGVSVLAAAQRPWSVPQPALSQPTYLLVWRTSDERDLKRLGEIGGGMDKRELAETVADLPRHAFAFIDTRRSAVVVSRLVIP